MNKYELTKIIEEFAPLETAEKWDCSGWAVDTGKTEVSKVMLCLTVTQDVISQAIKNHCNMIISHHPLFYIDCHSELVSESFQPLIDIYCAHTNLDKAHGGTTDTLIKILGLPQIDSRSDLLIRQYELSNSGEEYVRYVNLKKSISINDLACKLKKISSNIRLVNNKNIEHINRIAFCAGSGADFINEACENGADVLVTGDLKFHTALESPIAIFDIGHFESEKPSLEIFKKLLQDKVEITEANEKSPFINISE